MRLFREKIDPRCAYCKHGVTLNKSDVGCVAHGIVPIEFHCRRFRYDPLKRIPVRPVRLRKNYSDADFKL